MYLTNYAGSSHPKLAHEILHIIVDREVHQLASIVEFLFELILYIERIANAGDCSLWGLHRTRKRTLSVNLRGSLVAIYLVLNCRAFHVGHSIEKPFGKLDEGIHTM